MGLHDHLKFAVTSLNELCSIKAYQQIEERLKNHLVISSKGKNPRLLSTLVATIIASIPGRGMEYNMRASLEANTTANVYVACDSIITVCM